MTFTVTYRDRRGAKREEAIEAESRAACVAACRARGISPLAIREGAKGLKGTTGANGLKGLKGVKGIKGVKGLKGLLAALALLALLAGGAWWWFGGRGATALPSGGGREASPPPARAAATNQPLQAAARSSHAPSSSAKAAESGQSPSQAASAHMGRAVVEISATTNADGTVVERVRTDDGKIHARVYSVAEPVFGSATDQLLAAAVGGDADGPPMPGATKVDEKLFLESLKKPIEILDTDTPDIRALKEKVMQARADMAELLSQGRGFAEVLAEHRKMQEEDSAVRREVADELRALVESGDTAAALEYRKRVNAALEGMGIKPLETAITEAERAERRERRRARRNERLGR